MLGLFEGQNIASHFASTAIWGMISFGMTMYLSLDGGLACHNRTAQTYMLRVEFEPTVQHRTGLVPRSLSDLVSHLRIIYLTTQVVA